PPGGGEPYRGGEPGEPGPDDHDGAAPAGHARPPASGPGRAAAPTGGLTSGRTSDLTSDLTSGRTSGRAGRPAAAPVRHDGGFGRHGDISDLRRSPDWTVPCRYVPARAAASHIAAGQRSQAAVSVGSRSSSSGPLVSRTSVCGGSGTGAGERLTTQVRPESRVNASTCGP